MGKVLGVDYGDKKIGLAISDELGMVTAKLPVLHIHKKEDKIDGIFSIVRELSPSVILFGIPYGSDGKETVQSIKIRKFIEEIDSKLTKKLKKNKPIIKTWDESFSTKEAETGKSRKFKKEKADSEAARLFLQEYLNSVENK